MLEMTMKDWMGQGYRLVSEGAGAVRIMGKRPTLVTDDLSPQGEYGWQRGDQWMGDDVVASSVLPAPVFRHLKPCPNLQVRHHQQQGREVMPRWPTEGDALSALDYAAWLWALRLVEADGVTDEQVDQLVAIWQKETGNSSDLGRSRHPSSRPIVALGEAALPRLRKHAVKDIVAYCLIEEIEDQC